MAATYQSIYSEAVTDDSSCVFRCVSGVYEELLVMRYDTFNFT